MKCLKSFVTVLAFFLLTACAVQGVQTQQPLPLPSSLAEKVADCTFNFGNREGALWSCESKVNLTIAEAVLVEQWARQKDAEILALQRPQVNFSLFGVRNTSNKVTTSHFDRKHYGLRDQEHRYRRNPERWVWRPN
ncbi:MAG: hypothetical protein WD509_01170 [Candidatus Paceibacterota bacterium]